MLWTILVVLCVLWLIGIVTSYTFGGFIHILLFIALAILVLNLIRGRRSTVGSSSCNWRKKELLVQDYG